MEAHAMRGNGTVAAVAVAGAKSRGRDEAGNPSARTTKYPTPDRAGEGLYRGLWTARAAHGADPTALFRMGQYPVPNPLDNACDLARFANEDLAAMGRGALMRERSDLMDAMRYARRPDVPELRIPYTAHGTGCGSTRFTDWARGRMRAIEGILRGRAS